MFRVALGVILWVWKVDIAMKHEAQLLWWGWSDSPSSSIPAQTPNPPFFSASYAGRSNGTTNYASDRMNSPEWNIANLSIAVTGVKIMTGSIRIGSSCHVNRGRLAARGLCFLWGNRLTGILSASIKRESTFILRHAKKLCASTRAQKYV